MGTESVSTIVLGAYQHKPGGVDIGATQTVAKAHSVFNSTPLHIAGSARIGQALACMSAMHCSNESFTPIVDVQSVVPCTWAWQESAVAAASQRMTDEQTVSTNFWQATAAGARSATSRRSQPLGGASQLAVFNASAQLCAWVSEVQAMAVVCSAQTERLGAAHFDSHAHTAVCQAWQAVVPRGATGELPLGGELLAELHANANDRMP
jgi:hypothetical protein